MVKYFNQYCIYTITSSYESIVGIQPAKKEEKGEKRQLRDPNPGSSLADCISAIDS